MQIEMLARDRSILYREMYNALDALTDLKQVYNKCSISDCQELLRLGFDSNLYYYEGIYRTPTMIDGLALNALKIKEEGVPIYKKERGRLNLKIEAVSFLGYGRVIF